MLTSLQTLDETAVRVAIEYTPVKCEKFIVFEAVSIGCGELLFNFQKEFDKCRGLFCTFVEMFYGGVPDGRSFTEQTPSR